LSLEVFYLVYEELSGQTEFSINVSQLPQGFYLLKAERKDRTTTIKIGKL